MSLGPWFAFLQAESTNRRAARLHGNTTDVSVAATVGGSPVGSPVGRAPGAGGKNATFSKPAVVRAPPDAKKVPRKLLASIPVVRGDMSMCRLLDLSAELKNKIYELVLAPNHPPKVGWKTPKLFINKENFAQPALLRTCSEIRRDAGSIYYHDNKFHFDIKHFNSINLRNFTKQTGVFRGVVVVEVKLLRGSRDWDNLLVWLEAFYNNEVGGYSCPEQCEGRGCCAASMAFKIVKGFSELKELGGLEEALPWKKVLPFLEVHKQASQQKRAVKWGWA